MAKAEVETAFRREFPMRQQLDIASLLMNPLALLLYLPFLPLIFLSQLLTFQPQPTMLIYEVQHTRDGDYRIIVTRV